MFLYINTVSELNRMWCHEKTFHREVRLCVLQEVELIRSVQPLLKRTTDQVVTQIK